MTSFAPPSSYPQTPTGQFPSSASSAPGTPMSGISTVAIKDGHEGHPVSHDTSTIPRTVPDRGPPNPAGVGYFDRVAGWRRDLEKPGGTPVPPSDTSTPISTDEITSAASNDNPTDGGFLHFGNPLAKQADVTSAPKTNGEGRRDKGPSQIPLPPRSSLLREPLSAATPSSSLASPAPVPNPPCPTPLTPSLLPAQQGHSVPLRVAARSALGEDGTIDEDDDEEGGAVDGYIRKEVAADVDGDGRADLGERREGGWKERVEDHQERVVNGGTEGILKKE